MTGKRCQARNPSIQLKTCPEPGEGMNLWRSNSVKGWITSKLCFASFGPLAMIIAEK
jgi:hypothetical protein